MASISEFYFRFSILIYLSFSSCHFALATKFHPNRTKHSVAWRSFDIISIFQDGGCDFANLPLALSLVTAVLQEKGLNLFADQSSMRYHNPRLIALWQIDQSRNSTWAHGKESNRKKKKNSELW